MEPYAIQWVLRKVDAHPLGVIRTCFLQFTKPVKLSYVRLSYCWRQKKSRTICLLKTQHRWCASNGQSPSNSKTKQKFVWFKCQLLFLFRTPLPINFVLKKNFVLKISELNVMKSTGPNQPLKNIILSCFITSSFLFLVYHRLILWNCFWTKMMF